MKIRAIIVDDEPHAREGIRLRLKEFPDVYVVKECASGGDAVAAVNDLHPDLLFLDIQMPEMNGFEVLQKITVSPIPAVIFVTAYDKYAIQAFECHALDYLLKPIQEDRFRTSIRIVLSEIHRRNLEQYVGRLAMAASDYLAPNTGIQAPAAKKFLARLMVKIKQQISMISVDEIDWIESAGDYVYVHLKTQKHIVRETLTSLEERLDPQKFVRIHRTAIVNMEQIKSLKGNEHGDYDLFLQSGTKLKLSRTYRPHFEQVAGHAL